MKSTAELSKDYVRTSLNEFEDDPVFNPTFINEVRTTQPDSPLARAYQAFDECHFTDIPSLCTQELESSIPSPYKLQALLLRGSFYLLMGNSKEALADFDAVVSDSNATEKVCMVEILFALTSELRSHSETRLRRSQNQSRSRKKKTLRSRSRSHEKNFFGVSIGVT